MSFSCASAPEPEPEARPFIKLANRGLAAVVYWDVPKISSSEQDTFELVLDAELERSYGTAVEAHRREGRYDRFEPALLARFAKNAVDDVVVVELRAGDASRFAGRVKVVTVSDLKAVVDTQVRLVGPEAKAVEPLARRVWAEVTRVWIDPASGAPLDALLVADRLAGQGACREALEIYDATLSPGVIPSSVKAANKGFEHAAKRDACRRKITLEQRRASDARAVFELQFDLDRVAPQFHQMIREAAQKSGLERALSKVTDKPVTLTAGQKTATLIVRFHPERYRAQTKSSSSRWKGQPALFLDPWADVLSSFVGFREILSARAPAADVQLFFRLERFEGDFIELGLGGSEDRVLLSNRLEVHTEGRAENTTVETSSPYDLRRMVFTLGPPSTLDGKLTIYGVAAQFLGLD